ncbi:MAG: hypothetical protein GY943_05810 [Chloroflexi bacterium]|nr:hypothetical protein [Chloroflexota bacterium]
MQKSQLINNGAILAATGLIHRVKKPTDHAPHPTIIMLHGRFGNEDVMWIFAHTLPPDWLVISVRAPLQDRSGFSWHLMGNEWPTLAEFDDAATAVSHFIHALPQQYNADPEQIHLMGFSQGAATAFATAIKNPGLVQGIAGLVGFLPLEADTAVEVLPLEALPIFMAVGKQDPTIPVQLARTSGKKLIAAGANLTYEEFETGHKLNGEGMRKLKDWWDICNQSN